LCDEIIITHPVLFVLQQRTDGMLNEFEKNIENIVTFVYNYGNVYVMDNHILSVDFILALVLDSHFVMSFDIGLYYFLIWNWCYSKNVLYNLFPVHYYYIRDISL